MSSSKRECLSRVQRDVLRWRVRYLMLAETNLEQKITSHPAKSTHLAEVLHGCQTCIRDGIDSLLRDYQENPNRAATGYVLSHWEHLRQQYDNKLASLSKKKVLSAEAFGALQKGYETTKAAMGTAKTVSEVVAKTSYVVGGAGWSAVAGESQDISKMVEKIARILSVVVLGVFLLKDLIDLIVDRVKNPHKTLKSKLLEDSRWRRILKMTFFLSLAAVDLAYNFDVVTSCVLSGVGVFVAGVIELGRRLYEFKKIVVLHRQLEKKLPKGKVKKTADDLLNEEMFRVSKKKLCSKRLMLIRVSALTVLGVCGSVFLSLGTGSVPFLMAGAILSVFVLAVEIYHMRKQIKQLPTHVKQVCLLAKEKARAHARKKDRSQEGKEAAEMVAVV